MYIQITAVTPKVVTFVEDGTTNYIENVKTYNIVNGVSTLQKTEAVGYSPNGEITSYGNNYYSYDGIGRLIRENNADLGKTFTYGYDERGNIVSKKKYAYTIGTLPTTAEDEWVYTYSSNDLLTSVKENDNPVKTVTYNSSLKPINYLDRTFTWQNGELFRVETANKAMEYTYDISHTITTKTLFVDGIEILADNLISYNMRC